MKNKFRNIWKVLIKGDNCLLQNPRLTSWNGDFSLPNTADLLWHSWLRNGGAGSRRQDRQLSGEAYLYNRAGERTFTVDESWRMTA